MPRSTTVWRSPAPQKRQAGSNSLRRGEDGLGLGRRHATAPRDQPSTGRRSSSRAPAASSRFRHFTRVYREPSKSSNVRPAARYASASSTAPAFAVHRNSSPGSVRDDLAEVDAVAARVGVAAPGVLDHAAGDRFAHDLGELGDLVVLGVGADVERLVVHELARRLEHRDGRRAMSCTCTSGRHGVPSLRMRMRPVVYAQPTRLLSTTSRRRRGDAP